MTLRFTFKAEDLPADIPIFPLTGAVLLPHGNLPLNIFEPRYLAMLDHALRTHRMIGMVQPSPALPEGAVDGPRPLAATGCAGRITGFEETGDGRTLIVLTGICRFGIRDELPLLHGFRRVVPDWATYAHDLLPPADLPDATRRAILDKLARYFKQQEIDVDWQAIQHASATRLLTCLSMICPFTPAEKQALLEAVDCGARAELFLTMLEMAVHASDNGPDTRQ